MRVRLVVGLVVLNRLEDGAVLERLGARVDALHLEALLLLAQLKVGVAEGEIGVNVRVGEERVERAFEEAPAAKPVMVH